LNSFFASASSFVAQLTITLSLSVVRYRISRSVRKIFLALG
jgi:hypothetical protein